MAGKFVPASVYKPTKTNKIMTNKIKKEYALQVLQENYEDYRKNGDPTDTTTLREYVEKCADDEDGFFRWLFNDEDGKVGPFGCNLTDEQKEEYKDFLDNWCE